VLQNELKILQALCETLRAGNPEPAGEESGHYGESKKRIDAECGRIKEAFSGAIFTTAGDQVIERYIRHHQASMADLSDYLQEFIPARGDNSPEYSELIGYFTDRLSGLLRHTEKFFGKYFDKDAVMPAALRLTALRELNDPINQMLKSVAARVHAPALCESLTDYLQHMARNPGGLRYRDIAYFSEFLRELAELFGRRSAVDPDLKLCYKLIGLNFNHLGFYLYCQETIQREIDHASSARDQVSLFQHSLNLIQSIPAKPSYSYDPALPNIKTMLCDWIREETRVCEAAAQNADAPQIVDSSGKLPFNHSVAQIACLIHSLYDENCFSGSSITDVLRFAASNFRSKRQQQISFGSLSKEYYSVSQVNAAVMRDLFQRMTAKINKQYFPVWLVICTISYGFLLN
jgi:hypothetical protein